MKTAVTAEICFEAERALPWSYRSVGMTTPLIVETVRTLAQALRCLADSRRCVTFGRRLLNPAWGISGGAMALRKSQS